MTVQSEEIAGELGLLARRPVGRPTIYSDTMAAEICEAIALGGSLYKLCEELDHWPAESTVYNWADSKPEFMEKLTRARERKAHRFVEQMPDVAAAATPLTTRVAELIIKTNQWVASRLARGAYGDAAPQVNVAAQVNFAGIAQTLNSKVDSLADRSAPKVIEVSQ